MKSYLRWALGPEGGMDMLVLISACQLGFTFLWS